MTDVHLCETNCGRPAPNTYICWDCVQSARWELDRITLEDAATLLLIARRQATSGALKARSNGTGSGAGQDVINIGAYTLWANLVDGYPTMLDDLPHRDDAARMYARIFTDVERGLTASRGEVRYTEAEIEDAMANIIPMSSDRVCHWIEETMNLRIHPRRIRVWKHRGLITPREVEGVNGPRYHPADVLRVLGKVA